MNYNVIFASTKGGGIGLNGGLPWHIPEDLAFFKKMATDNLVCASSTYHGLPKVVQARVSMVQTSKLIPGVCCVGNLYPVNIRGGSWVIGGRSLLTYQVLQNSDYVYHTEVLGTYKCDTSLNKDIVEWLFRHSYEILEQTDKITIRRFAIKGTL